MLTPDDLQLLRAVQAGGSLSHAARALGRAVSTVSHAARQLEERMDALLFDRRGYRIALTEAGRLLVDEGARLHRDTERLAQRVQQVARGWESQLHIVVDELANFSALLSLVSAFDGLKSGVQLRFTHESVGGTWQALGDGRADVVVAATNEPPTLARLQWFELGRMDWVFAVSPHHPLARQPEPLNTAQMEAHRAVVVADSARPSNQRSYGLQPGQPVLAVPGMREKMAAQLSGLGCGWLPHHLAEPHLRSGALVARRTEALREPNVLYIGWIERPGRGLQWWTQQLRDPALAKALLHMRSRTTAAGVRT